MVARPGTYIASNNSGELKPELHGRTDLKQFYGGLSYGLNVEPVPQGGSRLSPRSRHLSRVRRKLQEIAPYNGLQTIAGVATAGTLVTIDFVTPRQVAVIVAEWLRADREIGPILQFQIWNGLAWVNFGAPFGCSVRAAHRSAVAPPRQAVQAMQMRLQLMSAPPAATNFTFDFFRAWSETAELSVAKMASFTFALDQTYTAIFTDQHVDLYRDGVFVGGAHTYAPASRLTAFTFQQRLDTMLVYHEDQLPMRVIRDGRDDRWKVDASPLTNVPRVDLGGSYGNGVVDIWRVIIRVVFDGFFNQGKNLLVSFTVNGEETAPVGTGPTTPVDWPAFAAGVKVAIEALPSVEHPVTVTGATGIGAGDVEISFTGDVAAGSGGTNVVAARVVNSVDAAATSTHIQRGIPGGEDLMSYAAGWPACALFYQDRLAVAGFKSKRGALLASVTGDYYNGNVELVAGSGAILVNLDTDGAERIHALARSRHLVIFTSDAEYYVSDRVLSKSAPPVIVNSSRNGSAAGIGVVETDGSLLYVSRNNALIYAATYDDVSTAYVSSPITLLASHIASNVTSMALQKATNANDAARLWLSRADGTATLGTMLRGESVTAFTRWHTAGAVQSFIVDGKNVAHALVMRDSGGEQELHFERLESGLIFDGTIEQVFDPPRSHIDGLAAHEGAPVWAIADGYVVGPFTVAGGAIDLPDASARVLVGRWTAPDAITLPLPSEVSERVVLRRPKRVHTVKLDLVDTTSVAIGANEQPPRDVGLARAGDPIDTPLAPVNRTVNVTGLLGFSADGKVRITQKRPGLLAWRGITIEART